MSSFNADSIPNPYQVARAVIVIHDSRFGYDVPAVLAKFDRVYHMYLEEDGAKRADDFANRIIDFSPMPLAFYEDWPFQDRVSISP